MKVLYSFLVVVATTMRAPLLMFSSTDNELIYAQQEEDQMDFIDIQESMNISSGLFWLKSCLIRKSSLIDWSIPRRISNTIAYTASIKFILYEHSRK